MFFWCLVFLLRIRRPPRSTRTDTLVPARRSSDLADDPVLATIREAAARHGLWVHIGSLALKADDDPERLVNRGFVIDDNGAICARYDKIHLFDVDLPSGERYRESETYRPGPSNRQSGV